MADNIGYRSDIDGLRAVAVLAVVGYHVGVAGFGGGFVGVDVFFVISGYLITQLLLNETRRTGRIDIAGFYARRARRLLPALGLVLVAALGLGWIFLTAVGEQQALAQSVMAAAGFVANIWFWRGQTGYFAAKVDTLPLLHTWTLSVEEQFYLVWPLLMIWLLRGPRSRVRLAAVLVVGGLISLIAASAAAYVRPSAAFFFTPFRAWEFAAGGLLALYPPPARLSRWTREVLAFAGLAAIAASSVVLSHLSIFPGWRALPAVLGATAIIAAASTPGGPVGWLLSSRPAVVLGRLSYGWYLWHWPLLSIARIDGSGRSLPRDLLVAGLALGMAAISYRFVEQPLRFRRSGPFASRSGALLSGAAILVVCTALAGALWFTADQTLRRRPDLAVLEAAKVSTDHLRAGCVNVRPPFGQIAAPGECLVGDAKATRTLLLIGDSHAAHLIPALDAIGRARGVRFIVRSQGGCRPELDHLTFVGPRPTLLEVYCPDYNRMVDAQIPALKRSWGVSGAIVAERWGEGRDLEPDMPRLVTRLRAQGLAVLLVADVPPVAVDVPTCLARRPATDCGLDRTAVVAARAPFLTALNRIAADNPGTAVWDPLDRLCDAARCEARVGGVPLYRDDSHISVAGSLRLIPTLAPAIDALASP